MNDYEKERRCLYISRRTILKTLKYRGYDLDDELSNLQNETEEEFFEKYIDFDIEEIKSDMTFSLTSKKLPSIYCIWVNTGGKKLGIGVSNIITEMTENDYKNCIIISDLKMTSKASSLIKDVNQDMRIDVFTITETLIFAPEHELNPFFRICSAVEKKKLMKDYALDSIKKLPSISYNDVIVKYLGAPKGTLLEITRKSETNEENYYISYRIVQ